MYYRISLGLYEHIATKMSCKWFWDANTIMLIWFGLFLHVLEDRKVMNITSISNNSRRARNWCKNLFECSRVKKKKLVMFYFTRTSLSTAKPAPKKTVFYFLIFKENFSLRKVPILSTPFLLCLCAWSCVIVRDSVCLCACVFSFIVYLKPKPPEDVANLKSCRPTYFSSASLDIHVSFQHSFSVSHCFTYTTCLPPTVDQWMSVVCSLGLLCWFRINSGEADLHASCKRRRNEKILEHLEHP